MRTQALRLLGASFLVFVPMVQLWSAPVPRSCADGARTFLPCEVSFDLYPNDLPSQENAYNTEVFNVEFRSPSHSTHLIRPFWDGSNKLRVRFSPTEPGAWTYHVTGQIKRYNDQQGTFTVSDSGLPGFVAVANVRHWWTTNKKPHLWLGVSAPLLSIEPTAFESWLDARKRDGFTHLRGVILSASAPLPVLTTEGRPNPAYFSALDDRLLAAAERGFALDLMLADPAFVETGNLTDYSKRDALLRYVVARYGALNVTWQGIQHFEDVPSARTLLKNISESLQKYDMFHHPQSSDARDSSSPLLPDNWISFFIEASPHPALAAVEHQFTEKPEIHVLTTTSPDDFRHELWNCTVNGEYPSVSYEALTNPANIKAVQTWVNVMADTRHWELEPYFDVDGARAVGLNEVEYLAYAQTPAIVEITLPKHKYNPVWINPSTGEQLPMKDYRGEVFNQQTPDSKRDWILQVPREGHKESMLRSYRFESEDPPIQEPELDTAKTPYEIADPKSETILASAPPPYAIKLTKANRATRSMQYVWWGEIVAGGEGARLLGVGPSGTFQMPPVFQQPGSILNVRLLAINANGKAYEVDRVYTIVQ